MKPPAEATCAVFVSALLVVVTGLAQVPAPKPAVPVEPISAILDAFKTHQIVALGEIHGNEQSYAFRLSLIRDPRFPNTVNDIVVESGNALYQDAMDRFVRGDEVPYQTLRQVWQNTTQANPAWDRPMYEAFFRAVRDLNASLPRDRQLRVLLGDPPIDWNLVRSWDDVLLWERQRNTYPAALIRREVLAKQRRALLIYGAFHYQRRNFNFNYSFELPESHTIVSLLEKPPATKIFTIWPESSTKLATLQADVASWAVPSLALLRGTVIGDADFSTFVGSNMQAFELRDGKEVPIPRHQWAPMPIANQFDAVLNHGAASVMTRAPLISPALCFDAAYLEMRTRRLSLAGRQNEIDQVKMYCARVTATAK